VLEEFKDSTALDAALAAAAQAVEHYEIARYGALKTWAAELGMEEATQLLGETLDEEKDADRLLTQLATRNINKKAA
jgi:ferritin-like metal-binding protein YciE